MNLSDGLKSLHFVGFYKHVLKNVPNETNRTLTQHSLKAWVNKSLFTLWL